MASDHTALETEFHDAQAAVAKQGDTVRSLKADVKDGKADRVSCFRARWGTSAQPG